MSAGERSCINFGKCTIPLPDGAYSHCNVDCDTYTYDGKTTPDTSPCTIYEEHYVSKQVNKLSLSEIQKLIDRRTSKYQIQKGWNRRKAKRKASAEILKELVKIKNRRIK